MLVGRMPPMSSNGTDTRRQSIEESLSPDDRQFVEEFERLVVNVYQHRIDALRSINPDRRRNIADECGYPRATDYDARLYQDIYDTEPYAQRVVDLMPKECWKSQPAIYETNDPENLTPFEEGMQRISQSLRGHSKFKAENDEGDPLMEYMYRLDLASGIGRFAVMLIGINDGLPLSSPALGVTERNSVQTEYESEEPTPSLLDGEEEDEDERKARLQRNAVRRRIGDEAFVANVNNSKNKRYSLTVNRQKQRVTNEVPQTDTDKDGQQQQQSSGIELAYLKVFPEHMVQISTYESNPTSPRFGQPSMYLITLHDPRTHYTGTGLPIATVRVHWSRVIHVPSDMVLSNEWAGTPQMKPVIRPLLDIHKVRGSSAEMYYKGAFMGLSIQTPSGAQIGNPEINQEELRDMIERYENGLQRYIALLNLQAVPIAPQVVDPTPQINVQVDSIAVQKGCPIRILKGSERGELSSAQDVVEWNSRIKERRNRHCTPRIICQTVDRFIMLGLVPEPQSYTAAWLDPSSSSDVEKVDLGLKRAQAIAAYVQSGVRDSGLMAPVMFMVYILGFSEEEAIEIYEDAQEEFLGIESGLEVPEEEPQPTEEPTEPQETESIEEQPQETGALVT